MRARAPRHLGCNGRFVVWDDYTQEGWCTCRRRWTAEQVKRAAAKDLMAVLTEGFAAMRPAMDRLAVAMGEAARQFVRMVGKTP